MFSLPGRAPDARARELRSGEQYFTCACGARVTRRESSPCQGAAPDACTERVCDRCFEQCALCDLPMCAEHAVDYNGARICHHCKELERQAKRDLLAALAAQAEEIKEGLEARR